MTAQYWSMTGHDIWHLNNPVCELKNLITGEIIQLNVIIPDGFHAVTMPKIERRKSKKERKSVRRNTAKKSRSKQKKRPRDARQWTEEAAKEPAGSGQAFPRKNARKKSRYKGVTLKASGKWDAVWWDGKNKKCVTIASGFESDILAAAAYQDHIGNHKEAKRLRNEYEEGDRMPDGPVVNSMDPGDFEGA